MTSIFEDGKFANDDYVNYNKDDTHTESFIIQFSQLALFFFFFFQLLYIGVVKVGLSPSLS